MGSKKPPGKAKAKAKSGAKAKAKGQGKAGKALAKSQALFPFVPRFPQEEGEEEGDKELSGAPARSSRPSEKKVARMQEVQDEQAADASAAEHADRPGEEMVTSEEAKKRVNKTVEWQKALNQCMDNHREGLSDQFYVEMKALVDAGPGRKAPEFNSKGRYGHRSAGAGNPHPVCKFPKASERADSDCVILSGPPKKPKKRKTPFVKPPRVKREEAEEAVGTKSRRRRKRAALAAAVSTGEDVPLADAAPPLNAAPSAAVSWVRRVPE